jgi:hypothetical protein
MASLACSSLGPISRNPFLPLFTGNLDVSN